MPPFTVGRPRESSPAAVEQRLKRHREFAGPIWRANAFHLMESIAAPGGAAHRTMETYPLRCARRRNRGLDPDAHRPRVETPQ